jgi:hypothetical protein
MGTMVYVYVPGTYVPWYVRSTYVRMHVHVVRTCTIGIVFSKRERSCNVGDQPNPPPDCVWTETTQTAFAPQWRLFACPFWPQPQPCED